MESNGKPVKVSELVEQARDRLMVDDGSLLPDMSDQFPAIRSFLIGGNRDGQTWPAGQIFVFREAFSIVVKISVRTLGVECVYRDTRLETLLHLMENDLATNSVRWELNYKENQRMQNKRLRAEE